MMKSFQDLGERRPERPAYILKALPRRCRCKTMVHYHLHCLPAACRMTRNMPTTPNNGGLTLRQLAEREERAFPTYPQVTRYFPAANIEDARGRLVRAIERGDGPGLIIGGPGTGKSLLLQVLATQYHERFDVVLPACARLCTRRALLQAILFELGLPYRVRDEGDLRLSLLDHLLSHEECPTGLLLLVDEAQTLSVGLLDELRVLTNLVRGGAPRVRLVLAGSSALEESFAHPDLESFSQRLSARCYLGPFGRDETAQFVRAQIAAGGASPEALFAPDAWEAIFEATDGVPRLVNQVCDRALVQANANGCTRIDRYIIQTAWADIQQLPAPWETPPPTTSPPAPLQVIEFGSLEETAEEERPSVDEWSAPIAAYCDVENDEPMVAEPTELDDEDLAPARAIHAPATRNGESPTTGSLPREEDGSDAAAKRADPFAEEFDEEEVVLDTFASWDDMFRRDTPRVHNRRDPEFAALIQSAISTAGVSEQIVTAPTCAAFRMSEAGVDDFEVAAMELLPEEPSDFLGAAEWPPLRLAVVPEPAPSASAAGPDDADEATTWSHGDAPHWNDAAGPIAADDDVPVLIVEDDTPSPHSPVRREEYRNLFSRLRGG
jgi:type II secretory pathway predicted ATPase ExeA